MATMKLITCTLTATIWLLSTSIGQSYLQNDRTFIDMVSEVDLDPVKANYEVPVSGGQNDLDTKVKSFWKRTLHRDISDRWRKTDNSLRRFAEITTKQPAETWTGRWLPPRTTTLKSPVVTDLYHGVAMGISSSSCDDAKTNLTLDWDLSPEHYTCYNPTHRIHPDPNILPNMECEELVQDYFPQHICMDKSIVYNISVPTHGDHRPLWPKYGEYKYVPVQRWLHSVEHGAIVMIYHPCANPMEVHKLKQLVKRCLWRHIITPYKELNRDRPLALVAWGCRLEMSTVNPVIVRQFIQSRALKGPEKVSADGQYDFGLVHQSELVPLSSAKDENLCPREYQQETQRNSLF